MISWILCSAIIAAASAAAFVIVTDDAHAWPWKLGAIPMMAVGSLAASVLERSRVFGGQGLPVR